MPIIPGITRMGTTTYSDARRAGQERDPYLQHQPELRWYHDRYPVWRSLFDGTALEEKISVSKDPASSAETDYRWPVRYNLVHSYCQLHAGLLWGRGKTGAESTDLFSVRVNPKVPGKKPATAAAPALEEILEYFWSQQSHVLRPLGMIQQWAGGCVVKVSWDPASPSAVWGIKLEIVQPEHFYPIWDPTCFEDLYAAKVVFAVSKGVAIAKYGLTEDQLKNHDDRISVEEYWDQERYWVRLGQRRGDDKGTVGKWPSGAPMMGPNPYIHPVFGRGVIPFVYIPRVREGSFMGRSLAYDLEGLQGELNKTLADYGDALTDGSHPSFGISDFSGPGAKDRVIVISKSGAVNLGHTRPGGSPPKVQQFPGPQVPEQTPAFIGHLLALSESASGLTPAARGVGVGGKSSLAMAMEMLPTTNLIDSERSHWTKGLAHGGGINEIAAVIWWSKRRDVTFCPPIEYSMFDLRQGVEYRPVVPRDRVEIIDEVVRLATARAVSPQEWLRRLGDIKDMDEEFYNLISFLTYMAKVEAAVAGRSIKVSKPTNPESPPGALPEVSGETAEPAIKQPAKQPEGQTKIKD